MNINVLIDQVKKEVGLNGYLGRVYNDVILRDSIINNSLVTFNRYSGFHIVLLLDSIFTNWTNIASGPYSTVADLAYRIPDIYMERFQELGVTIKRAFLKSSRRTYGYNNYSRGLKDDLINYNFKQRMAINTEIPTITFRPPNSIVVKGYGANCSYFMNGLYNVVLECTHPKNLSTISIGLESYFVDLCKYDIMINLYNNDLRNLKVEIGSSSVDINLENFQSAESDKKSLLETIRSKAAIDQIVLTQ